MKFNSAYPSLLGGVSQKPPGLRRPDQHAEQVNMIADEVRGLTRRQGSLLLDSAPVTVSDMPATLADADQFQEVDLKAGVTEITAVYRRGAKPAGSALDVVAAFDKSTGALYPVEQKPGDSGLALLESGGVSAAVALGRFLLLAGNTMTPTYSRTDKWAPADNQKRQTVWVRGGAYSRTFSMALIRGNQKFWITYTTRSASYPDTLDTSDLLPTDPDYTKKVNDRTNLYNSRALQWAGEALRDATPENIAGRMADELRASGFLSPGSTVSVAGSTICIEDASVEEVEVLDGGDGSLMRCVGNVVGAPEFLTTIGYPGKVVKVKPTNTLNNAEFYVQAVAKDASAGAFTAVTWEEAPGVLFEVTRAFAFGTLDGGSLYLSTDLDWLEAQTGVPFPRFLPSVTGDDTSAELPDFLKNGTITMLGVFQDRLIIGAGPAVNSSRTSDYLNFFPASLLDVSPTDPVNFGIIGGEDDTLRRALVYDRSLVISGDKRQYVVNGRVPFSPTSASATVFSHIPDSGGVQPVAAGNFMFIAKSAGGSVSLQQIAHGQIEESPNVQELTQDLDTYIAGSARGVLASNTPSVVVLRAAARNSLYLYQFTDTGRERRLSAWQRWDLAGPDNLQSAILGMSLDKEAVLLLRLVNGEGPQLVVEKINLSGAIPEHPYLDLATQAGPIAGLHSALIGAYTAAGAGGSYVGSLMDAAPAPGGAWHGYPMTGYVTLTSPQMKAQEGIGRIAGEFVVGRAIVQIADSGGVVYRVETPGEEALTAAYGGEEALYPESYIPVVGVCQEVDRAMQVDITLRQEGTSGLDLQVGDAAQDTSVPQVEYIHGIARELIPYEVMSGLVDLRPEAGRMQLGLAATDANEPVPSVTTMAVGETRVIDLAPFDPLAPVPYAENFNRGAYTEISGNTAIYTGGTDVYGPALFCASQSAGTVARIERDVTLTATAERLSIKFKVTADAPDDAATFKALTALGEDRFTLLPRREAFFDSTRRCCFFLGGQPVSALGTAGLTLNAWHQFDLVVQPSNDWEVTLTRLSDSALVGAAAGNAAGILQDIAKIAFFSDSGGTTAPCVYSDLVLGYLAPPNVYDHEFRLMVPAPQGWKWLAVTDSGATGAEAGAAAFHVGPNADDGMRFAVSWPAWVDNQPPVLSVTRLPDVGTGCCLPNPLQTVPCTTPTVVGPSAGAWAIPSPWGSAPLAGAFALTPYDLDDYALAEQDPATELVNRTGVRAKSRLTVPVAAEANSYALTLASYLWTPLSITGIEFDGQFFSNSRRI